MHLIGKIVFLLLLATLVACSSQPSRDAAIEAEFSLDELRQRAQFANEAGEHGEALHNFSLILAKEPDNIPALLGSGETLLAIDKPERAEARFVRVLSQQPKHAAAREGRALAWLMMGSYADARTSFRNLIEDGAETWRVRNGLGIIADLFADYDGAVMHYRRAIALAPERTLLQNNLGYSLLMNHNYAEAESVLERALKSSPDDARLLNNLAMAIAWQGRYDEAVKRLQLVMGEAEAVNNVGYVAYLAGNYPQAEEMFRRALRLKPSFYQRAAENLDLVLKRKEDGK